VALQVEPGHSWRLLDELRQVARLYDGMASGKGSFELQPRARQRALQALTTFSAYCRAAGFTEVVATATSAVRDATNGLEFLAQLEEEAGMKLELLDSSAEAAFGVLAVANSFSVSDAIVLDVGGGSAQLSLMQDRRYVRGASFPLGAVRVTQEFFSGDPAREREVRALVRHIRETAGRFLQELPPGLPVIGMGGTIRNLADIRQERQKYPLDVLHGYQLETSAIEREVYQLREMSLAERRRVAGLNSDRADIMVGGSVVVHELLRLYGAESLTVSGQGLREGLFYPHLFPDQPGHLVPDVREFSVLNLMRHYDGDYRHFEHVKLLALQMFDQLQPVHGFGQRERELLAAAALLHDIGMAINYYEHHKHSSFLIQSSGLPGFSHRELALIALMTHYHRKRRPTFLQLGSLLRKGDQERLELLTGMLRLAEYLERSKSQRVTGLRCVLHDTGLTIEVLSRGDAQVETGEARARRDLLAGALGLQVEIREAAQEVSQ
jgi:exopolyphosphatase/guanosine-5'-triphosphate,3'-diphosphate pyrophosphatase